MSLFPSTLTGRVLDDGQTPPPVIELQGISAGQLSLVLTQYTPLETTTQNTADIGTNAAAIAALQGQVAALPAAPDLEPYALASDLASAEGSIAANASGLVAVNTSLTQGLATKANQSALDALQVEVNGKSTPASVDLKLANHPTTAAMNSAVTSANNATLATVATTYALKSVVDQLALDVAARQTAADVDQRVATALLAYVQQAALDAALALRDGRLDGHDADILALQSAGPFALPSEITALQASIDAILAEIATLGGATNLVNAPAWLGEVTWDLLVGTNQVRNLHAVAALSIALANDNWTLSLSCDAYSRAEADALLLPKASESWVLAQLGGYYTTQQADDAIAAALTNHFTRAEVTANLVAFLAQANTYTDDQLLSYSDTAATNQLIADALLTVTLSNGQSWNGGPTFNLLRGTQVLRNLSVAGALTATFQNLDDTILIESDSYARGETYTQAETGAAITAAIDALNLSQYRTEAQVLALIAGELGPYWDQTEVANYVAGELANYQTSSQVSSAISSALSSYDDSSQVDSKIVTALMDFYTRAETDQAIADAVTGGVDLSPYYTSAETDSLFYPRTELDSLLTATLTQYWTSGRTQTEIDDAVAGLLDQATADTRYFVRAPGAESGNIFNLVQEQFTPRIVRNLLLEAPLQGDAILGNQSTLRLRCDSWTKAEADSRFLRTNDLGPLDARYFPNTPGAEGGGIFNLVQTQFTPVVIRNLLCQTPLSCQPILGNGSTLQISCDCWSKGQSDGRYPLIANFNSLGQRVTDLENAPGVDPTADLTVNSLTATAFVQTPLLQSAAADLQLRNATTTIRAEDGTLLASFATGSIGLEQDITVRADRTLNATTADFAQFFVGSTAATGTFASSSSITATQEIESDLRLQAPLVRSDPAAPWLTVQGGTNGILMDDTVRINGVLGPEASLPFLSLSGGTSGVQVLSPLLEQIAVGPTNGTVGVVVRNAAATGEASLLLDANNQNGVAELKALAGGGVQLNSLFQFISMNNTNGLANLAIEPNTGGSLNGEVIFGYGHLNASDRRLKTNIRRVPNQHVQRLFDAVEPQYYDRIGGGKDQLGFIAQDVQAAGKLGETLCKTMSGEEELLALDYQKLSVVLWGVVKGLQKRVDKLEKKRGKSD